MLDFCLVAELSEIRQFWLWKQILVYWLWCIVEITNLTLYTDYMENLLRSSTVIRYLLWIALLLLSACRAPITADNAEQLALGKAVYDSQCASCHGLDGEGQPNWKVPDANGILPAPPHDSSGHTWHHSDPQLLEMIAYGSTSRGSPMIGYGEILSQSEMDASLAYIKTFWGEREREYQAEITEQASK